MPDLQRLPLTFEHGVKRDLEESSLPIGFAPLIENWEPTAVGGLRVREAWSSVPGGPVTPKTVTVAYQQTILNVDGSRGAPVIVHDGGTKYSIYVRDLALLGQLSFVADITATTAGAPLTTAMTLNRLFLGGPSLDKLWALDNAGSFASSGVFTVPQYTRALAFHDSSLWAGGNDLFPNRLFWTDPGINPLLSNWPALNFLDVGADEQDTINGLCSFNDSLFVGTQRGLWIVSGSVPDLDVHDIRPADAVPGRPLIATPYGLVIVGATHVWLYDGATVNPISEELGLLYTGGPYADAAYWDSRLFVVPRSADSHMYVRDMRTGTWTTENRASSGENLLSVLAARDALYGGPNQGASDGLLSRQRYVRLLDSNLGLTYTLRTPEYWVGGPDHPVTFRHLELKLRQRGGSQADPAVSVKTTIRRADGSTQVSTRTVPTIAQAGVFRTRLDLSGETGHAVQFEITHALQATQGALMDIEEAVLLFRGGAQR